MEFGMSIGASRVSDHRQSVAAESISRTLGNSVAAKFVCGERGALFLGDRTECGGDAHSMGESKEIGIRKNVLCPPRRPEYNHTRKGALINRNQDEMPNRAWDCDGPAVDRP